MPAIRFTTSPASGLLQKWVRSLLIQLVQHVANGIEDAVEVFHLGVEGRPELQGVATEAYVEAGLPQGHAGLERTDHGVAITRGDLQGASQAIELSQVTAAYFGE